MMQELISILMGFVIGMGCRWFDILLPAPPGLVLGITRSCDDYGLSGCGLLFKNSRLVAIRFSEFICLI
ncbi:MAG: XapX domain-containing protein [Methylococcales bacterium]